MEAFEVIRKLETETGQDENSAETSEVIHSPALIVNVESTRRASAFVEKEFLSGAEASEQFRKQLISKYKVNEDAVVRSTHNSQRKFEDSVSPAPPPVSTSVSMNSEEPVVSTGRSPASDVSPDALDQLEPVEGVFTNEILRLVKKSFPEMEVTPKAISKLSLFLEDFETSLVELCGLIVEEKGASKMSSIEVTEAILKLLSVSKKELMPKNALFSRYFGIVDTSIEDIQRLETSLDWIFSKDKDGVAIWYKNTDHQAIRCMKGVTEVSASAEAIMSVLWNAELTPSWDSLCIQAKVLEVIDNHTHVLYLRFGATVCLLKQLRDFVVLYHWYSRPDGSVVMVARSVLHETMPETKEFIRGEIFASGYVIQPKAGHANACTVTYITHVDVKASMLAEFLRVRFINLIHENQPMNVARLRRFMAHRSITKS